jgi:hypothetical protein
MKPYSILLVASWMLILIGCSARIDKFRFIRGGTEANHSDFTVSASAIRCGPIGQQYSIPGFLTANGKANGLQIQWTGTKNEKLEITGILAHQNDPKGEHTVLDIPFDYWYGKVAAHPNIHYAFVRMVPYSDSLAEGHYRISLSYKANGVSYTDEFDFEYVSQSRAGIHTIGQSHYF